MFLCGTEMSTPSLFRMAFLFVAIVLFVSGCASMQEDYEAAKKRDTVSGWNSFLRSYPDSKHAAEAEARVAELKEMERKIQEELRRKAWMNAQKIGTAESYWKFLKKYKAGDDVVEAKKAFLRSVQKRVDDYVRKDTQGVRPGVDFPINRFTKAELVIALGPVNQNNYVGRKKQGDAIVERHVVKIYRMLSPSCGKEKFTLCFIRKKISEAVMSISRHEVDGIKTTTVEFEGIGYAIVRKGDVFKVYELSDNSWEYSVQ